MQIAIILLEWLATFFLAVEAIKLENLSALRARLHRGIRWINPTIRLVDGPTSEDAKASIFGYAMIGACLGGAVIFFTFRLLGLWTVVFSYIAPLSTIAKVTVYVAGALLGLQACMLVGGSLIMTLEKVLRLIIRGLGTVERNTASGVIGISGFLLFSLAAIAKLAIEH